MRPPVVAVLVLCVGVTACSGSTEPTPHAPEPTPSPVVVATPTPVPSPTPEPTPTPSHSGIRAELRFIERELVCKKGVTPPKDTNPFKVGCSVEVRVDYVDRKGAPVEEDVTGNNVQWSVPQGGSRITLPDDSNPWRRWMTAVGSGDYRIVATLTLKKTHEKIVGEIAGHISH